jgi:hypothetical protein
MAPAKPNASQPAVFATVAAPKPVRKTAAAKSVKKPVQKPVQKPAAPQPEAATPTKASKPKLVRDSFTFPKAEYELLAALKKRVMTSGHEVKKSELLRAGIALLSALDDAALVTAVGRVEKLKTGRPAR